MDGERSDLSVSCRSTTRCQSLAMWSPWEGNDLKLGGGNHVAEQEGAPSFQPCTKGFDI